MGRALPQKADPPYPLNYATLSPLCVPLWSFTLKRAKEICVSRSRRGLTGVHHLNAPSMQLIPRQSSTQALIGEASAPRKNECGQLYHVWCHVGDLYIYLSLIKAEGRANATLIRVGTAIPNNHGDH